tara:strand:+ start:207 stop:380 length:174 start_codon:yes stop_codon:yes gene_type:complete
MALVMGKGSKRRPQIVSDDKFQEAWNNIFPRKKTPPHATTQVHKDKTKIIPRKAKHK